MNVSRPIVTLFVVFLVLGSGLWGGISSPGKQGSNHQVTGLGQAYAQELTPEEQTNIKIYKTSSPAVVNITSTTVAFDFFYQPVPKQGSGSGVIISGDGYVLTNYHVVQNAQRLEVTLSDGESFPAKMMGGDPNNDVALLKIDPQGKKLPTIPFGHSNGLFVGQKVYAIGNPFGLTSTLTTGVVSSLSRSLKAPNGRVIDNVIQTDAAINPGNSGGPLLDSAGRLIGINTAIFSPSGASAGIGFAIPINQVKRVTDDLMAHGRVIRPYLGVRPALQVTPKAAQLLKLPVKQGIMVGDVFPGSPAETAGLHGSQQVVTIGNRQIRLGGDIILQADDQPVTSMESFMDYIESKSPGDKIQFKIYRDGNFVDLSVVLKERPESM